jgi:hypothetical protein
MDKEDIIRMAREAGATREHPEMLPNFWTLTNPDLERFASLVAAAERERILDMCKEGLWDGEGIKFHLEKRGQE